jgi:hypothetical protein
MFGYPPRAINEPLLISTVDKLNFVIVNEDGSKTADVITGAHFMTITGIHIDKIKMKTTLTLSNWGKKIEIDLDDYINNHGLFGGFVLFNRHE